MTVLARRSTGQLAKRLAEHLAKQLAKHLIDIKDRPSPLPSLGAVLKRGRRSPGAIEVLAVNHPGHKRAFPVQ